MTCDIPKVPGHLSDFLDAHEPVLDDAARDAVTEATATSDMDRHRLAMRRYDPQRLGLPSSLQAQCPQCGDVVAAEFKLIGDQVVLEFNCPSDGKSQQVHFDNLFTNGDQHLCTYTGAKIQPVMKSLPRTVETLCPECSCVILGRYFVRDGAVWIEKTCPDHGYFRDCVNADVNLYAKSVWSTFVECPGVTEPHVRGGTRCPSDCGLCESHQSPACLANIDLTNRCNLKCPICFANANVAGFVYEPDYDQVVTMMQRLRDLRPIPCTCIQFSGGEPTLHGDFFKIIAKAGQMGFSNIQIATNGLKMADVDFARQAAEAGLHTLYLQFDGTDDDVYRKTRGRPLMKYKLAAIENCRKFQMKVCLVPTIVKGQNSDQVGRILHFAAENADVISGISYQPVSFTGRIDMNELQSKRYTVGDLTHDIAEASGADPVRDFFPLSFVVPFSKILSVICKAPKIQSSCHTDCAAGTIFWVSPDKKLYPFPQVFDIDNLFWRLDRLAKKIEKRGRAGALTKLKILYLFYRYFRPERAPKDMTFYRMIRSLGGMVNKKEGRGKSGEKNYRTLMAAGMHFQDRYNFDVQRIKRCVILYSTPEGIVPFCTYNCGPSYRSFIERQHCRQADDATSNVETTCETEPMVETAENV